MNQPDICAHVAYLRRLGVDFAGLRSTLSTLSARAQGLATRSAAEVTGLDGSHYIRVPGNRSGR
ncbi:MULTISPECIES: hypothetical protein [unclassified Streptomyces]|uniref:hypothetical protein n=1 Tax=unclassified Streptomyces TaxID=2593676 RepID=UPI00344B4F55